MNTHHHQAPPRHLDYAGGRLNFAGRGRAPGAYAYLDTRTNVAVEVFALTITSTGSLFSLGDVVDNTALRSVKLDAASFGQQTILHIGQHVLVAGIENAINGPRARSAWLFPAPKPTPAPLPKPRSNTNGTRLTGRIATVANAATFGFIEIDGLHTNIFVHAGALTGGARLVAGDRVSFAIGKNDRGPAAVAVRPL